MKLNKVQQIFISLSEDEKIEMRSLLNPRRKAVIATDINTGSEYFFDSIGEFCRRVGANPKNISRDMKNDYEIQGYKLRFA